MWSSAKLFSGRGGGLFKSHFIYLWDHVPPALTLLVSNSVIPEDMIFPMITVTIDIVITYRISINPFLSDPAKEVTARSVEYFLSKEHFTDASAHLNLTAEIDFFNKALSWWCKKYGFGRADDSGLLVPQLKTEADLADLFRDLHKIGVFTPGRCAEGVSNFHNANCNFLCAIAKRGVASSQWCIKRSRTFVLATGDDYVRLEKGFISEIWSVMSTKGVKEWDKLIAFLIDKMTEMGLGDCAQVMRQAANSGHTTCILINCAIQGRPDFNWEQIITGSQLRLMRTTDVDFVDHTSEWYQETIAERCADKDAGEHPQIHAETMQKPWPKPKHAMKPSSR